MGHAPLKLVTCCEMASDGIFKNKYSYVYSYRDNSYISCAHIVVICSSIIISSSTATGSDLLFQMPGLSFHTKNDPKLTHTSSESQTIAIPYSS